MGPDASLPGGDAVPHHRVRVVIELGLVDVGAQQHEGIVVVLRQAEAAAVVCEVDVAADIQKRQVKVRHQERLEVVLVGVRVLWQAYRLTAASRDKQ